MTVDDYKGLLPKVRSRFSKLLTTIAAVLSVMGIVTFSLFILEESFQTIMFGTWPAQDAQRWDLVKRGTDHMRRVQGTLVFVNTWFGWIQPFAYISYREYAISEDFYIESLRAKAMANAPELFVGEPVELTFAPKSAERLGPGILLLTGASLAVVCRDDQRQDLMTVKGVMALINGRIVLDIRKEY